MPNAGAFWKASPRSMISPCGDAPKVSGSEAMTALRDLLDTPSGSAYMQPSVTGALPRRTAAGSVTDATDRMDAGVAQLVRALACHARGRGFKSRHSRHSFNGLSQSSKIVRHFF